MSFFVAALDPGQISDPTALVIIEAHGTKTKFVGEGPDPETDIMTDLTRWVDVMPVHCDVRHIERFQLGGLYRDNARVVAQRIAQLRMPRYLALDRTGVGVAVIEHYQALSPIGIMIHGGDQTRRDEHGIWYIPKRDLVSVPQLMFQNKQLRIAAGRPEDVVYRQHAELLFKECMSFKMRINARTGHDTYEAWREGEHDDLVLALSIACWTAQMIVSTEAMRLLHGRRVPPEWTISPV